jgi:hypothetical protein
MKIIKLPGSLLHVTHELASRLLVASTYCAWLKQEWRLDSWLVTANGQIFYAGVEIAALHLV